MLLPLLLAVLLRKVRDTRADPMHAALQLGLAVLHLLLGSPPRKCGGGLTKE